MTVTQDQFHAALLDPEGEVPGGLTGPKGQRAGSRFSVYRNNVVVGLIDALKTSFPVIMKLLGPTNFSNIAGIYVRETPPKSPLMMYYGDDFADFLEAFPPLIHLGYLGDIARLEHARRLSYHAADAAPIAPDLFANLSPQTLANSRFVFAPAMRLIQSQWPILDIWSYNTHEDAPQPSVKAQNVLITRPGFDLEMTPLGNGDVVFLSALQTGQTLGQAQDIAMARDAGFAPSNILSALLRGHAITERHDGFASQSKPSDAI